ncbi:uncharacterized protein CLAFUR5_12501 [Fulvia fulva]|uniref:Uncharacterized protein n=1 Tax=Passalora fulva TaxID=5499 RepID=A0A9Q8PIN5_PASFU|nr:uncharacterized protein CLAFUR5_12501 [Fulvia fulva]KAK4616507.1 hypothetical protein CLAFUR0_09734 [Fulvia fulva]UJO23131.1 hypothetical protein CLAFUR5_12501 [Fulvia fulva]WPV34233.1 hypothetical protein CLAFUW7_09739 [Fulvia fulva]
MSTGQHKNPQAVRQHLSPTTMPTLITDSDWVPQPAIVRDPLQFEGRDIKIALDVHPQQDFLLNSELLLDLSTFFNGSKKDWAHNAKVVQRPATEAELQKEPEQLTRDVNIVTYHLAKVQERVYMLETKPPRTRDDVDRSAQYGSMVCLFYLSELAHGFLPRSTDTNFVPADGTGAGLARARYEHGVLFRLLFKRYHEIGLSDLDYTGLADLVALAEAYDIVEFVAPAIREDLPKRKDLWQDVRKEYKFHLALSIKLRCEAVFYDALRHLIGSGDNLSTLVDKLDFDLADAFKIAMKREQLRKAEDQLRKDLQALTLATYIPHARKNDNPDRVRTTHASSQIEIEDRNRAQEHAHSLILETLAHHLVGQTHWSHVREYRNFPTGVFSQSSLRNFCNAVTQACQTDTILELFAPDAANDIEATDEEYNDGKKPYLTLAVEDEIKKVITQMANTALPYIAPPDFRPVTACTSADSRDSRGLGQKKDEDKPSHFLLSQAPPPKPAPRGMRPGTRGKYDRGPRTHIKKFKRVGMTANDDSDCHYFTCVEFGDEELGLRPWGEDDEGYRLEGLEAASEEWKGMVGLDVDGLAQ